MTTDHEQKSSPESIPLTSSPQAATDDGNGLGQAIEAECKRLRQRVLQLEAECGSYHRSLMALLRERCVQTDASTDTDLDRLAEEALRLGDFDEELRQLLQQR